ncbi:MAG: TetR/AcrR family transcriptional regulator [Chroococcidiopsidaceae cyanobacterium CP_BM_RX_35]|nr:TetR/AcrR family transcriptional regulator [Chroococcidiopsidaceae cyanobacterium CP_BM_RX_35]
MRDIAEAVGIRQASLYYHFPSKEQLFVAVTEQVLERHRKGLRQAIDGAGLNLRTQLQAVAHWFLSQPPTNFFSMLHVEIPTLSEEYRQQLFFIFDQCILEPIHQTFIRAREQGQIRDVKPETLTGFVVSLIDGINYASTIPEAPPKQEMAEDMVSVLLDGLQPP